MGNPPSKAITLVAVAWKRLADISTAAWVWSLLPSGALSVIAAWRASVAGLPDWAVLVVAISSLALVMVALACWRIWRAPIPLDSDSLYQEELQRQEVKERAKRAVKAKMAFERVKGELAAATWVSDRPEAWTPLHAALRYLVYESAWGHRQCKPNSVEEFDRLVALEFRERLARGEVRARGAKGGAFSNPEHPTEVIPAYFWQFGTIQPHAEIEMEDANRAAAWTSGSHDTYRRVVIYTADLKSVWPRSNSGINSKLASFVEPRWKAYVESREAVHDQSENKQAVILPDITFEEVIVRILKMRGLEDDGSPESLKTIREIGQEVGDQMSLRKLSTWARRGGTLEPLPFEISKKGVGVGRDSSGKIHHMLQYTDESGTLRNVTDYRFLKAEIGEVWPDG